VSVALRSNDEIVAREPFNKMADDLKNGSGSNGMRKKIIEAAQQACRGQQLSHSEAGDQFP